MARRSSSFKEHGTFEMVGPDGAVRGKTLQCCHCGRHFVSAGGSGHRRGFCTCCMQVTCGASACMTCLPLMKRIELVEAGKRPAV